MSSKPKTTEDCNQVVERALEQMAEALSLLDNAGADIAAIHLDQAINAAKRFQSEQL